MASRIDATFASLRLSRKTGLITYLTAGYPDVDSSAGLIHELGQVADAIELGLPCANPSADGPVIRNSHRRALANGVSTDVVLNLIRRVRATHFEKPIVLVAYLQQVKKLGAARFFQEVLDFGADAVLIPDLRDLVTLNLPKIADRIFPFIPFVSQNTDDDTLVGLVSRCSGFVYMASQAGRTGGTLATSDAVLAAGIARIRGVTNLPIGVGIGIKTPDDARRIARLADAVIVGTVIVQLIQDMIGDKRHSIAAPESRLRRLLLSLTEAMSDESRSSSVQVSGHSGPV
jgi:tryptophan synthase alpha chain